MGDRGIERGEKSPIKNYLEEKERTRLLKVFYIHTKQDIPYVYVYVYEKL